MNDTITIREAINDSEVSLFWEQLRAYFIRDLFPDPEDEDRAYFLSDEYRTQMQRIHDRMHDRCRWLFFQRNGQDVGLAQTVIFDSEDGKCFIMEFCVYPEFRGGTGTQCARALLEWARGKGAAYAELNCGDARRRRFWNRLGFIDNGADEWGEPLMILPPEQEVPIEAEILDDPDDWQLMKLMNGFLAEIGEPVLNEEKQEQLRWAVRDGSITFFVAKHGYRAVGMCSVAKCFSTFTCANTGVFDDFYIEPAFRKKGAARKLAQAARKWCSEKGIASLTVTCAPCDEAMYNALGFGVRLGATYARII